MTLLSRPGPFVILSATDMAAGTRFEFIQDQFDLMCVDLTQFPLSRAVAASAAVPVLLSPIVVQNHSDRCPPSDLSSFDRARREGRLSSRQIHQVDKLQSYLDVTERPYIHLLDGGLADNLGLRSPLEAVFLRDGAWSLAKRIGIADVRKVVFIVVHASTGPDLRWGRTAALPGLSQVLQAVKDIPIDRYSFETKELLAANFERWAADIREQRRLAGGHVRSVGRRQSTDAPGPRRHHAGRPAVARAERDHDGPAVHPAGSRWRGGRDRSDRRRDGSPRRGTGERGQWHARRLPGSLLATGPCGTGVPARRAGVSHPVGWHRWPQVVTGSSPSNG